MKKAPMLSKKSNEKPDKAAPAVDLAMPLIDIRQDAAQQDAQEKSEFSGRKKIAEEKEERYASEDMRVEEHGK